MNSIGYFEIQYSDVKSGIKFYESIFGWKFIREDSVPIEYYRIETNTINGGILKRPAVVPPMESGTNAFVCSIQVENFDKISEIILQNGGQIAMPKFAV